MTVPEQLETMTAEAGLEVADLEALTGALAPLAELTDTVPAPSPELAALLGGTVPHSGTSGAPAAARSERPRRSHGVRRTAIGALVLALSGVGATGLSAAANTLPEPLQHRVSQFSHDHLPFEFPEPDSRTRGLPEGEPDDGATVELPRTPAPSDAPARRGHARGGSTPAGTTNSTSGRSDLSAPVPPGGANQGSARPGTAGAVRPSAPEAAAPAEVRPSTAHPSKPAKADAGGSAKPAKPDKPVKPTKPAKPAKPAQPAKPAKPGTSGAPAANPEEDSDEGEQGRGRPPRE